MFGLVWGRSPSPLPKFSWGQSPTPLMFGLVVGLVRDLAPPLKFGLVRGKAPLPNGWLGLSGGTAHPLMAGQGGVALGFSL
jgi:hypothetical protein